MPFKKRCPVLVRVYHVELQLLLWVNLSSHIKPFLIPLEGFSVVNKLKLYTSTVLIPLKTGKNSSGSSYLSIAISSVKKANFFRTIISSRSVGRKYVCKEKRVSGIL